ncbi:MAG: hypothetical protein IH594_04180 [Bacteroidales bacterium]|nr:hypothetical protein [Bacteroidales bacterium]
MFNHKSTYHIKSGFLGKYITFCTYNDHKKGQHGSALIRADVETGDMLVLAHSNPGDENHFYSGNAISMVPNSPYLAVPQKNHMALYDIYTSEKIEFPLFSGKNNPEESWGTPAGTCDGKYLIFPYNDQKLNWNDPEEVRNKQVGHSVYRLEISSGKLEEVFRDEKSRNNHVIANPVNPDLCLIDRDLPPKFYGKGDDGVTPRVWILEISTRKVIPVVPREKSKFAWHSNWNYDGTHVYYHGPSSEISVRKLFEEKGGKDFINPYPTIISKNHYENQPHFIGVADSNGTPVWEATFPRLVYGHTGSHSSRDIMYVDNLITDRQVVAIHWRELNDFGMPLMELAFAHNSYYYNELQVCHPHCTMSDDAKWMSYNAYMNGRADVYVAQMQF